MTGNGITLFRSAELSCNIRTISIDDEPWFIANDICESLEIGNPRSTLALLDEDEKGVHSMDTLGGTQRLSIINESGLYSLILRSRKPEAKKFKKWVTAEVLPSIRKHGMYATGEKLMELLAQPENAIKVFRALKDEQDRRKELEAKVEENAPKVLFCEAVQASSNSVLVGELAKILRQNGVPTGQNRLFAQLREEGYLGKVGENYNLPTQRSMDMGLFEIKKWSFTDPNGVNVVKRTTKVTGKGQVYFVTKFLGRPAEAV